MMLIVGGGLSFFKLGSKKKRGRFEDAIHSTQLLVLLFELV